jgi:hypothetical protein
MSSIPSLCPADDPFMTMRLRLSRRVEPPRPLFEREGPDPVAGLGAVRQHTAGVEDLHHHSGPARLTAQHVAHLERLPLGMESVGAVHVQSEEVLDPVVGVGAGATGTHLDEPRPDRRRRCVDRDRPGGKDVGVLEQFIAGKGPSFGFDRDASHSWRRGVRSR